MFKKRALMAYWYRGLAPVWCWVLSAQNDQWDVETTQAADIRSALGLLAWRVLVEVRSPTYDSFGLGKAFREAGGRSGDYQSLGALLLAQPASYLKAAFRLQLPGDEVVPAEMAALPVVEVGFPSEYDNQPDQIVALRFETALAAILWLNAWVSGQPSPLHDDLLQHGGRLTLDWPACQDMLAERAMRSIRDSDWEPEPEEEEVEELE